MNLKKTLLICKHPTKLPLRKIDSIMSKYKICIIRGIVKPKDLKDPMKKLKIFIKKTKICLQLVKIQNSLGDI